MFKTIKRLSKTIGLLFGSSNIANVDDCTIKLTYVVILSTNMLRTAVNAVKSIDNINR